MAETLASDNTLPTMEVTDLSSIVSRIKELSEMRLDPFSSLRDSNTEKLLESYAAKIRGTFQQVEAEDENVESLGADELELYLEQLKKEINCVENEKIKIHAELDSLMKSIVDESARFDGELDGLEFLVKQALQNTQDGTLVGKQLSAIGDGSQTCLTTSNKFEILELQQRIEESTLNLSILKDLDHAFKRDDAIGQIEDMLSEVKVIEIKNSRIRLQLKTPISNMDGSLLKNKLNYHIEPSISEHELLIEISDNLMEIKGVEIVPDDIYLDEILDNLKFSRQVPRMSRSLLGWLIRQIELRVLLCTLRQTLVNNANKSRYSLQYSDKDELITAHLVGGLDAFIKVTSCWPISNSALKLISVKSSDLRSRSISLVLLCKVKDLANSLDMQRRCHLTRFVDAIEEMLVREMQSELQSNGNPA